MAGASPAHRPVGLEAHLRGQATESSGLSTIEAQARLIEFGPNELEDHEEVRWWRVLVRQFASSTVALLVVACLVSLALGDVLDALAILAILILNAAIGFRQEYGAERSMAALRRLTVPVVRVRRDGRVQEVSARELVPGDLVLLEPGDLVPADGHLALAVNLRTQEAALTGESEPVDKRVDQTPSDPRADLVFAGTAVLAGRGEMIVTTTGMRTELGRIAALVKSAADGRAPLERKLEHLSRILALAAVGIVSVVFAVGLLRGEALQEMFLTAVSLAVAAVPEGLPAVVTIALALGARRMLERHALVRRLSAVETLGSVTVICSDKTGTLTENRMTVVVLDVAGHRRELREALRHDAPMLEAATKANGVHDTALQLLLIGGALCNDAVLEAHTDGTYSAIGDPTEGALMIAAAKVTGGLRPELEQVLPRIAEAPFDADRKRMTTVHARGACGPVPWQVQPQATHIAFTKGATDQMLAISRWAWLDGRMEPLDATLKARIQAAHDDLAQSGMRVLALGFRLLEQPTSEAERLEQDLIFVGLFGLVDPARPEAREAVARCRNAGIRPVMITGDHPLTARYIAESLGLVEHAASARVLTGSDLERLNEQELEAQVESVSIFARVTPQHKLEIVRSLQHRGHIVAMTGDGVNDAPALEQADIGVAMGITGTEVAKEAAEIVLKDDNFATIVAAVEEGRMVFENIRKFVRYILTGNIGELAVMLCAPLLGLPLPLTALQILWINLVTDGLPGLALTLEPVEQGTMHRPPRPPNESLFARGLGRRLMLGGAVIGLVALGVGFVAWVQGRESWRTMIFTTLTLAQMTGVLALRSEHGFSLGAGFRNNPALLYAVAVTVTLQLVVIYVPWLAQVLELVPLSLTELLVCVGAACLVFAAFELEKVWTRRRR